MRVYIAGPMTGVVDNNRAAFAYTWNRLMREGFDATSPHFMESAIEVETKARMGQAAVYRHVLPVDLFALSGVDAVLALPGWEDSKGAQFERHFARLIEIPWVMCLPVQGGLGANVARPVLANGVGVAIDKLKEFSRDHNLSSI